MAGDDLYVRVQGGGSEVQAVIDAHRRACGSKQTPVVVGAQTVYMTAKGAELYQELKTRGYGSVRFSVHEESGETFGVVGMMGSEASGLPPGRDAKGPGRA